MPPHDDGGNHHAAAAVDVAELAGFGTAPQRGVGGAEAFITTLHSFAGDSSTVFAWVFVSAAVCLALGIFAFAMMEERPLRSTVAPTTTVGTVAANPGSAVPTSAPSATPAE